MKTLLFPGQGSQAVGMGVELFNNFEYVKEIFFSADEKLKYKISKIILEGPQSDLQLTQNTQPAILIVSYAIFTVLEKEFDFKKEEFKFFAGHSLGEYSALVCSNSLKFSDALYLLHERGKAMQEAVPVGKGGMLAVLNLSIEEVQNFILKIKNKKVCEIANDNANGQVIISGDIESIQVLQNILKENKKKCLTLPVSAPFHCSLMKSAAEKMNEKISSINFKKPDIDIISNVTALPETSPEKIQKLLVEQIYSKVRWRESVLYMENNGVDEFVEIGPGKVLTGLVKRITTNKKSKTINSIEDMKNLKNGL